MYPLHFNKMFSHIHLVPGHALIKHFEHLMHDKRFWGILALAAFGTALIILMAWVASAGVGQTPATTPYNPFEFPLSPFPG